MSLDNNANIQNFLSDISTGFITDEIVAAEKYFKESEQMFLDFHVTKIKTDEDFFECLSDRDIFAINSSLKYAKTLYEYAVGNYTSKLTAMIQHHMRSQYNKKTESYNKQMRFFVLFERKRAIRRLLEVIGINQDFFGYGVLHFTIMNCCSLDFLKFLIKYGADLSVTANYGQTVLFYALKYGIAGQNLEIFEYLVDVVSSNVINTLDSDGNHIFVVFNVLRYSTDVFSKFSSNQLDDITKVLYTKTHPVHLFEMFDRIISISNKKNQSEIQKSNLTIETLRSEIQQSNKTIKDLEELQKESENKRIINDQNVSLIKNLNAEIQNLKAESCMREKIWRMEVHRLMILVRKSSEPNKVPMVCIPSICNGKYTITYAGKEYGEEWSKKDGPGWQHN